MTATSSCGERASIEREYEILTTIYSEGGRMMGNLATSSSGIKMSSLTNSNVFLGKMKRLLEKMHQLIGDLKRRTLRLSQFTTVVSYRCPTVAAH
jgi:hypothetical protein